MIVASRGRCPPPRPSSIPPSVFVLQALAAALLRQGAHVVICGRRLEALRRTEEELRPCAAKPGQVVKARDFL